MMAILGDNLVVLGKIVVSLVHRPSASTEGWDELDAAFIESQRVAEVRNGIVRTAERQVF